MLIGREPASSLRPLIAASWSPAIPASAVVIIYRRQLGAFRSQAQKSELGIIAPPNSEMRPSDLQTRLPTGDKTPSLVAKFAILPFQKIRALEL